MQQLFNGHFFQHMSTAHYVWLGLVAVLTVSFLVTSIRALGMRPKERLRYHDIEATELAETVQVECVLCGWKGEVPRRHKRCPNCGKDHFL